MNYSTLMPVSPSCVACADCGAFVDTLFYPMFTDKNGRTVCEGCKDWNICADCGEEVAINDTMVGLDCNEYCSDCYHNRYAECNGCNETIDRDEAYIRNGYDYCRECAEQYGEWDCAGWTARSDCTKRAGSSRRFGVEIETDVCADYEELCGDNAWGAKDDGSINGKEFVSDVLSGDDGLAEVDRICDFASHSGWGVDRRCGLHIHLDISRDNDASRFSIGGAYLLTYDFWKACVNPNRWNNIYCEPSPVDFDELSSYPSYSRFVDCQSRYYWVNFAAYTRHTTLEIRLHEGSVDGSEICNWIRAHIVFADYAAKHSLAEIKRMFGKLDATGIFHKMCAIWAAAGCADLCDYYANKAGMKKPGCTPFESKIELVRELGSLRGIR